MNGLREDEEIEGGGEGVRGGGGGDVGVTLSVSPLMVMSVPNAATGISCKGPL